MNIYLATGRDPLLRVSVIPKAGFLIVLSTFVKISLFTYHPYSTVSPLRVETGSYSAL